MAVVRDAAFAFEETGSPREFTDVYAMMRISHAVPPPLR
jgi:hypothetical protein